MKEAILKKWNDFKRNNKSLLTGNEKPVRASSEPCIISNTIMSLGRLRLVTVAKKPSPVKVKRLECFMQSDQPKSRKEGVLYSKELNYGFETRKGYIVSLLDRAQKALDLHNKFNTALRTGKLNYLTLKVGMDYRLLNKGKGWVLMSHNDYDREVDK